jgi:hypothetical protein
MIHFHLTLVFSAREINMARFFLILRFILVSYHHNASRFLGDGSLVNLVFEHFRFSNIESPEVFLSSLGLRRNVVLGDRTGLKQFSLVFFLFFVLGTGVFDQALEGLGGGMVD